MELLFGEYIAGKRKARDISLRQMAENLGITPAYLSDIEKGRRNPPDIETLIKIAKLLHLTPDEKNTMLDYAGNDRKQIAPDLPGYIMDVPEARTALRKARDLGKQAEFWKAIDQKAPTALQYQPSRR